MKGVLKGLLGTEEAGADPGNWEQECVVVFCL